MTSRVALVVGGAGDVGAAVARRLAASGVRVVLNYHRTVAAGEQVVADIRASGGEAVPAQADVRDEREALRALETGELFFGPVDLLVACACPDVARLRAADAGSRAAPDPLQLKEQLRGALTVIRTVTRGMVARGSGRIVCVTTHLGSRRLRPSFLRSADREARVVSRYAAVQLGPYSVAAYVIPPGAKGSAIEVPTAPAAAPPGGACAPTPADVAALVASLAGEDAHAAPADARATPVPRRRRPGTCMTPR